jgi:hypothetical protein
MVPGCQPGMDDKVAGFARNLAARATSPAGELADFMPVDRETSRALGLVSRLGQTQLT